MRRIEMKTCRECKAMYRWESSGIIMTLQDHMDMGLCERCRTKMKLKKLGKMLGAGKKLKGSVCNVPVNLLGKIEKYVISTFVVACDMDVDMPHTISLVGEER